MPAIGSSSSRHLAPVASTIAISSWRRSPCASTDTAVWARSASPTCCSAAIAGSTSAASVAAARQKRKLWPACACTASAVFCSTVKSLNTEVIW